MKTKEMSKLQRAVVDQLEMTGEELQSTLEDVCNYGAAGGVNGFIYNHETTAFALANLAAIRELATEQAEDMGYGSAVEMIAGFICLIGCSHNEVGAALYGADREATQVLNALAWYALEETARALCPDL